MRVRAAEPEGIQTHQGSACHGWKLLRLNGHAKPQPRKINRRIRRFQVNVARNFAFFKHTEDFGKSCHPGRGFKVSEVSFDAPHGKSRPRFVPQHLADRAGFNGVARLRTGAVRFHVGNARFREFLAVNPCHQRRLRLPVGKCNPGGAAVRIHGRRPNHCVNRIPVFLGLSERLQKHHRPAFAPHVPVRFFVKNAAGTGFREHVRF